MNDQSVDIQIVDYFSALALLEARNLLTSFAIDFLEKEQDVQRSSAFLPRISSCNQVGFLGRSTDGNCELPKLHCRQHGAVMLMP